MSTDVRYGLPNQYVVFWHAVSKDVKRPDYRARSADFDDIEKARKYTANLLKKETEGVLHQQRFVTSITYNFSLQD